MSEETYGDDYWQKRSYNISYLLSKLEWEKEEILDNYDSLLDHLADISEGWSLKKRKKALEYGRQELEAEVVEVEERRKIEPSAAKHPVFYMLDNFTLDLRRTIEFMIVILRDYKDNSKIGDDFSFGKFLNHVDGEYSSKSDFVSRLEEEESGVLNWLEENREWLDHLNSRRTHLTHYGIELGIEETEFVYSFNNPDEDLEEHDELIMPEEVEFDGKNLPKKLENDIERVKSLQEELNNVLVREHHKKYKEYLKRRVLNYLKNWQKRY